MVVTNNAELPSVLTKEEVRSILRFKSLRTISRMMQDGRLKATKIGRNVRFNKAEVLGLLNKRAAV